MGQGWTDYARTLLCHNRVVRQKIEILDIHMYVYAHQGYQKIVFPNKYHDLMSRHYLSGIFSSPTRMIS